MNNIKRIFINLLIMAIFFLLLFIFFKKYILLSLSIGIFVTIINNLLLYATIIKLVNFRNKRTIYVSYIIRYIIYGVSLYLVYRTTNDTICIIVCALSFLSFQIFLFIDQFMKGDV